MGLLLGMRCCPYKNLNSFVFLLWLETKMFILDDPLIS